MWEEIAKNIRSFDWANKLILNKFKTDSQAVTDWHKLSWLIFVIVVRCYLKPIFFTALTISKLMLVRVVVKSCSKIIVFFHGRLESGSWGAFGPPSRPWPYKNSMFLDFFYEKIVSFWCFLPPPLEKNRRTPMLASLICDKLYTCWGCNLCSR